MEAKKLLETEHGTILVISGAEQEIVNAVKYRGSTSSWANLVAIAVTGREVVLEVNLEEARLYLEMKDLPIDAETKEPITSIDAEIMIFEGRRFELEEGPSRAKTTSSTKDGVKQGKLRFTVYVPEDDEESDECVALEEKDGRIVVYHSMGTVPFDEIQIKK